VGAFAGLRYIDPELVEQGFALLPGAPKPRAAEDLKAAEAAKKNLRGELDQANNEKGELQQGLDAKNAEVKNLSDTVAALQENEKAVLELRNFLAKKNIIDDKTDVKEIPKALSQTLAAQEAKDTLLQA